MSERRFIIVSRAPCSLVRGAKLLLICQTSDDFSVGFFGTEHYRNNIDVITAADLPAEVQATHVFTSRYLESEYDFWVPFNTRVQVIGQDDTLTDHILLSSD